MIRSRIKTDTRVLSGLSNYAARFDQRVYEAAERSYNKLADEFMDDIRQYPPPPPNSEYERTFDLRNGWTLGIRREAGSFVIELFNKVAYVKYVMGSLAQALSVAASFQARVHQGRWRLASEIFAAFRDLVLEDFNIELAQELTAYGTVTTSQRAYTR